MIDLLLAQGANINQRSRWWAAFRRIFDTDDHGLADFLMSAAHTWISTPRRGWDASTTSGNCWLKILPVSSAAAATARRHYTSRPPPTSPHCCLLPART